jgi:aspartate/methionine/tyrosine aminotransferase
MEVMRAAAEREAAGLEVLHLEVGQPSTPAPAAVRAAARAALDDDVLGYTSALGLPELRTRISQHYLAQHGVEVDPGRVVVTTGASGSCVLAFLAMFRPGDRVAVLEPGYPCYRNDLLAFGVEPIAVPVGPDTGFRPTPTLLDAVLPLDGLVLASPSNPTGTVIPADEMQALVDWAGVNDVQIIVDEIYHGVTYGDSPLTALGVDGGAEVTVFNSFSKYWSMTGWRLGWIVAPEGLVTPLERLAQNLTISAPTLSQLAGVHAFEAAAECEANRARYERNRAILLDGLPDAGLGSIAPPDGAFYIWSDVSGLLTADLPDSQALCSHWLDTLGIAATPGIDFDPTRGDRFVRFSYAGSETTMHEAVRRLQAWAAG